MGEQNLNSWVVQSLREPEHWKALAGSKHGRVNGIEQDRREGASE